jgi:hypothetical protein
MEIVVVLLVVAVIWLAFQSRRTSRQLDSGRSPRAVSAADLEAARRTAQEDVTRFGEELQRLDADVHMGSTDEAMLQDWQRALDSYESASRSLEMLQDPAEVRHVTSSLEDGRYAVACVRARRDGLPLPTRRPPCFFNPAHGPSTDDVEWAPPGGRPRQIPVCAADADRLSQGAEPDVRTVPQGAGRVPYWQGGPAYSPWASGYFGAYAGSGLLPGFLVGTLLASSWDGTPVDAFETGDTGGGGDGAGDAGSDGGDAGGDSGGDSGGDWGGDAGGFDSGGFDFGGDFGGF